MEIKLTPELEKPVEELVHDGPYENASEAVIDALRRVWVNPNTFSPSPEEMLLEGVKRPHEPITPETLERIREMAVGGPKKQGSPPESRT